MPRPINDEITRFVILNVDESATDIAAKIMDRFDVSRMTASKYLRRMVDGGLLEAQGQTRARRYKLKTIEEYYGKVDITPETQDDTIWRREILPHLNDVAPNVRDICAYGFTEMFNNVIDHSESEKAIWAYSRDARKISLTIRDYGIGIFEKIQRDFHLDDHRQALFELSKGKLTSDPSKHTGEGIFFTSRMFDYFVISSMDLFYSRKLDDDHQVLVDVERPPERLTGTMVVMEIDLESKRVAADVFAKYETDAHGFSKTLISVSLAKFASDQLVSRSQAKRLMMRLDKFREIALDFTGVDLIGQGFADEVFRVFVDAHPETSVMPLHANAVIRGMLDHVRSGARAR